MEKKIYFISGMPRSGSTLLCNILAQNPRFHSTATSGVLEVLFQLRNYWDKIPEFQAAPREQNEQRKLQVLNGIIYSYFKDVERPIVFDKSRGWLAFLEMSKEIINNDIKVLVPVRDLRDVMASIEKLYRKTASSRQISQEDSAYFRFQTAAGRMEVMMQIDQLCGSAYNRVKDAITRGWGPNMMFVEYGDLTERPKQAMEKIYEFLGEKDFEHDFEHVEQVTTEDDFIHVFKDLHKIRPKVEAMQPQWPVVFDSTVFKTPIWRTIEEEAFFWRTLSSQK